MSPAEHFRIEVILVAADGLFSSFFNISLIAQFANQASLQTMVQYEVYQSDTIESLELLEWSDCLLAPEDDSELLFSMLSIDYAFEDPLLTSSSEPEFSVDAKSITKRPRKRTYDQRKVRNNSDESIIT